MSYDISILWGWLALAAALGGVVGWRTETEGPQEPWRHGWFWNSLIALVVVAIAALLHFPSGRLGFWAETAVLFYVAYLLGCLAGGALLRRRHAQEAAAAAGAGSVALPPAETDPPKIEAVEGEERHGGRRPVGFVEARGGQADNLQRIRGIGPQNEERLNQLGVYHYSQIAAWTPENVHWVGSYLAFPGRIEREQWIAQAASLAAGGPGGKD